MRTIKSYKTLTIFFLFLIGVVNYLDRSARLQALQQDLKERILILDGGAARS